MKKIIKGTCHICGKQEILTREHIPPQGSYPKDLIFYNTDVLNWLNDEITKKG